jgi:dTDP-4-amino-4,6-dideoxygalactose transaminase
VKLRRLDHWTEARRTLAAAYDRLLSDAAVMRPACLADVRHVYCLYTIQSGDRDGLESGLAKAGIKTAVHYPQAIHLMPAYAEARYKAGDFPAAEAAAQRVLSIPLHAHLTMAQVERVAARICELAPQKDQDTVLSGR